MPASAKAIAFDDSDARRRLNPVASNDDNFLRNTLDEDAISFGSSFYGDGNADVRARRPWGQHRRPSDFSGGGPDAGDSDQMDRYEGDGLEFRTARGSSNVDEQEPAESLDNGEAEGLFDGAGRQARARSHPVERRRGMASGGLDSLTDDAGDDAPSEAPEGEQGQAPRTVRVDREMVPFSNPATVQTGELPGSQAGIGRLGGARGWYNQAKKNPLIMFPKRAFAAVKGLVKGIGKLGYRGLKGLGSLAKRGWQKLFGRGRAAAADANAVPAPGLEGEGGGGGEGEAAPAKTEPTIEVDGTTAYGKRMIAQEQAREQFAEYRASNPDGAIPGEAPQGWKDTKFGSANSLLTRLRGGGSTTDEERDYMHAMNAKAMAVTKQREEASPENPSAFPFAQKTQADSEDTGLAKLGHVATATGAAINDREEARPDEKTNPAGAKAWDALNIGTNAIKAGTKFVDKQIKNYVDKDYSEKVVGGAGKAYLETGKAAQFTYGFVGKDAARLYDAERGGTAGKDLTKELDPYLGIKNLDRVVQTNVEILPAGGGEPGLAYSKNLNAGSVGKYVENVANIAQAAGTGLTESYGKPFEKMHAKRGELLSDQFVTTVARRKLQAERANRDGLIDEHVDPERQGVPTFLNANAEMLQAGSREYRSAQQLGKQAQQEGYASNFGLDMDTTAMLNDKTNRRVHGAAFNKAMNAKREAEDKIAEKTALDAALGTDDEDRVKREAAAKRIGAGWFKSRAWGAKGKASAAEAQVAAASSAETDAYVDGQRSNIPGRAELQAKSPLTWGSRRERTDGVDKEQWRGLWNDAPEVMDRSRAIEEANARRSALVSGESGDDSGMQSLIGEGSSEAGEDAGPVTGRQVRRRTGFGRALAGVGQGVGKTLSTTGAVIGFDNGENDLKQGNLKTAAAKAAMSEVYQNGMTGGLGYIPVVGKYAKTVGLAALTPLGEGVRKAGEGLEEAAFGKENRDRQYNAHWGLESPNATDETRSRRAELRDTEAEQAEGLSSSADRPAQLKRQYVDKVAAYNALKANAQGDDPALAEAGQAVKAAREGVFGGIRQLRETEQDLGYSRRRELARTGLVMPPRAEAPFVQPQVPLTEEALASHRAQYPDQLSAALPKQLQVYKSKAAPQSPAAGAVEPGNLPVNVPDFNVEGLDGDDKAGRASVQGNPVVDRPDVDDDEGSEAFGGSSLAGGESQGGDPRPREDEPRFKDKGSGEGMNYVSAYDSALDEWKARNPGRN